MKKKVDEKGIVYLEQPQIPTLSLIISLFSLLLISLGTLSIFAIQAPLEQPQDTTSQAVVQNGPVTITSDHSPDQLSIHQLNTIDLLINTTGIQTQGTSLVFNVITNTADIINVDVVPGSNMKATSQEIQKTADGFLVKIVTAPIGTTPFSSTSPARFLRVSFNPHSAGLFRLAFDQDYSHVYLTNSHDEILGKIPQFDYTVLADKGNACNHSCSSNDDCAVNLRCYNGACRSATNISSDTCSAATVVTQVSCNQGCANSSQCANGNQCFDNRCRNPGNPDSTVCANVTQITYTSIVKACNVACSSNKECAINLRCYNGACRLATNPSSTSCTPSNVASVSSIYTTPTSGTKGQEVVIPTPSPTPSLRPSASPRATPLATPLATVRPSATPFVWPTPIPATEAAMILKPTPTPAPIVITPVATATDSSFLSRLRSQATLQNISFPLIAIVSGVLLLIISLLLLFTRGSRSPQRATLPNTEKPMPINPKQPSVQEQSLEQRISELQSAQGKSTPAPTPVNLPRPAAPISATPTPVKVVSAEVKSPEVKPKIDLPPSTLTIQPLAAPSVQSSNPSEMKPPLPTTPNTSTMMDRLKDKGVMDKMPNPTEPDQGNK